VIHYYRCLGSDAWRRLSGPVCNNRPVRQDLLDDVVWAEIVRLLEQPQLIDDEINRRLAAAREADPTKRREQTLRRQLARIRKSMDRLLTAYQEGLISLDELRQRMPDLRQREQADNSELQAIADQSVERAAYLRTAQSLTTFLARLRASANALDVSQRQRIMRLLVKEILVSDDKIIIRHSIPLPIGGDGPPAQATNAAPPNNASYLLRSWSHNTPLRGAGYRVPKAAFDHDVGLQESEDEPQDLVVLDSASYPIHQHVMINGIEGSDHRLPITTIFLTLLSSPAKAMRLKAAAWR
jgi:site-specific DNA recombinase